MPRGGQNRKPRQAKIIQGTFRKDRNPNREPMPPVLPTAPKPPAGMNRWARRMWKELISELMNQNLATTIDLVTLELCCDAYGMYKEAKDAIFHPRDAKTGKRFRRTLAQYLLGRNSQTMPEMTTMKTGSQLFKAYMAEFGLSPASRNRINLPGPKDEGQDPMEKILNEM